MDPLKNDKFHHSNKGCQIEPCPDFIGKYCKTHRKKICKCGYQFKHHDFSHLKFEIKNQCASCGNKFQNSPQYYQTKGNYCLDCLSRIAHINTYQKRVKQLEKLTQPDEIKRKKKALKKLAKKIKKQWQIEIQDYLEDYNLEIGPGIQKF